MGYDAQGNTACFVRGRSECVDGSRDFHSVVPFELEKSSAHQAEVLLQRLQPKQNEVVIINNHKGGDGTRLRGACFCSEIIKTGAASCETAGTAHEHTLRGATIMQRVHAPSLPAVALGALATVKMQPPPATVDGN